MTDFPSSAQALFAIVPVGVNADRKMAMIRVKIVRDTCMVKLLEWAKCS